MVAPQVTVELTGPFFTRDPSLTFRENIRQMLEGLAEAGQEAVQSVYPVGPTGDGRAGVRGRVESLSGKKWWANAVISQTHVYPWPNGGERQYRGGKTEAQHHMFRNVARSIRVQRANLTEGLE